MSDMEQSDVAEPVAPAPDQSQVAEVTEPEALSLADAARSLLTFVKAHRTAGDSDLDAAVADVEAALPAQDA